jgi:hypothetical protein
VPLILKRASTSHPSGQWSDSDFDVPTASNALTRAAFGRTSALRWPQEFPPLSCLFGYTNSDTTNTGDHECSSGDPSS